VFEGVGSAAAAGLRQPVNPIATTPTVSPDRRVEVVLIS
jgi:hypothetical protein